MLFKKMLRTLLFYKAQFISMIIMITLGVTVLVACNVLWGSLEYNSNYMYETTNMADYRIYSDAGFTEDEVAKVKEIEGIKDATRVLSTNLSVKDSDNVLNLNVIENYTISKAIIVEGSSKYDESSDGIYLNDKYAKRNNISVGETVTVTYNSQDITLTVVALVKSGEYLIPISDETQLLPNFEKYGYFYMTPKKYKSIMGDNFYSSIFIDSDLDKITVESEVESKLGKSVLLTTNDENISYSGVEGEIEECMVTGIFVPIIFLVIAFLTMITTMQRVTINEKIQIGTLKALGFKDKKITIHYTSFGFFIGLIGVVLGIILGFIAGAFMFNESGSYGIYIDFLNWTLVLPWYCYLLLVLIIALLTLITFLSVRKILKGTASEVLRPYVIKNIKQSKFEKTKLWNKLSFSTKWNLRDIFRHKARSLMSLLGVFGCALLLCIGFSMKESIDGTVDCMFNKVYTYESKIFINDGVSNDDVSSLAKTYNGDMLASQSISLDNVTYALEIYNAKNGCVNFIDKNNNDVTLSDDGAYICLRMQDKGYNVGDTITISPFGTDQKYEIKVIGVLRNITTESIIMTNAYADSINFSYNYNVVFTKELSTNISSEYINSIQNISYLKESMDTMLDMMDMMVGIIIIASVILGIVVLYNLGLMNYLERYRELSTLKVVGFKDKRISSILITENLWITILGIIIALPVSYGLVVILFKMLASEYEMAVVFGALTIFVSVLLTLGVSMLVSLVVSRKNKKIDMTKALKVAE